MSQNITTTPVSIYSPLLSKEVENYILWILHYVIYPSTSVIGICSNLITVIVLTRQGLKKSSNILLVVLAVSDVLFLIGLNNFPQYIFAENVPHSFRYSESVNYMCYVILITLIVVCVTGNACSMAIPVLIAGERILAIFFPLHLRFIVTPLRIWIVTSLLFVIFLGCAIYQNAVCLEFYSIVNERGASGFIAFSPIYYQRINGVWVYDIIGQIINNMTGTVPCVLVSLGCVVLGIQIKIISIQRLKMTSSFSQKHSHHRSRIATSKTTKSLLSVCLLFIVCSGFAYLVPYLIELEALQNESGLKSVLFHISNFILIINSIGNFIVYAAFNKNFRTLCKVLFSCC